MHRKSRRVFLVLSLALALPALAGKADAPAATDRILIETSHLIAPERIGDFVLEANSYDDQNKYAGAGFRYALREHQETRFDVFVYPAGRGPQAEAIASGMLEFRGSIEQAQELGRIRDLQFLSDEAFPLQAPGPAEPATTTTAARTALDVALAEAMASTRTVGKRLRMHNTMVNGGFPMLSNGYLFHRQLYFFKVRASAARDRIDQATFDALADLAARTLVPAIEVANIGGCSQKVIEVPKGADSDTFARILVQRTAEIQGENCFVDAASAKLDEKSKSARVVRIDFTASDWKPR